MDNNTWVKLYRKSKDNGIMRDPVAFTMFSWILLSVNKETGEYTTGRFMLAGQLGLTPSTAYKALKRLEKKYKMVTLSSNNKFTTVRLLNWSKYQERHEAVTQSGNNKVTTGEQQSNNKVTLNKNKEIRNKNREVEITASINYLKELPPDDLKEFYLKYEASEKQIRTKAIELANYCEGHGKTYRNYRAMLNNALIKDFGMRKIVYAQQLPESEIEMSLEQKEKASAKLAEMRAKFHREHKF